MIGEEILSRDVSFPRHAPRCADAGATSGPVGCCHSQDRADALHRGYTRTTGGAIDAIDPDPVIICNVFGII